jgi:hypothetical protein
MKADDRLKQITASGPSARRRTRPQARPDALAYTVDEVRQIGGPARTKTYELIKQGKLKAIVVGGRRLICGESLRALLRGEAI